MYDGLKIHPLIRAIEAENTVCAADERASPGDRPDMIRDCEPDGYIERVF